MVIWKSFLSFQVFGYKRTKINVIGEKWILGDFFIKLKCRRLQIGLVGQLKFYVQEICMHVLNKRTNGPVNAHLISWPSKAQNIQSRENIW